MAAKPKPETPPEVTPEAPRETYAQALERITAEEARTGRNTRHSKRWIAAEAERQSGEKPPQPEPAEES